MLAHLTHVHTESERERERDRDGEMSSYAEQHLQPSALTLISPKPASRLVVAVKFTEAVSDMMVY